MTAETRRRLAIARSSLASRGTTDYPGISLGDPRISPLPHHLRKSKPEDTRRERLLDGLAIAFGVIVCLSLLGIGVYKAWLEISVMRHILNH